MIVITETKISKKGKTITLRSPVLADAPALRSMMVAMAETAPYIASTAEDFRTKPADNEEKWIERNSTDPRGMLIVAECDGRIIGNLEFSAGNRTKSLHRGHLGMGIVEDMRGEGVGELLLKKLFAEAPRVEGLTQIELGVMHPNTSAHNLYKKMGFKDCGRKPNAFKLHDGTFADEISMYVEI
ncbi:N-acetyltransferase family protein [Bdellovibrio sp. HCB288]|uniref:GNAT family N-acetyltransferase n=1 Tax=Bdellovibrio sp. HCB288 TaxID=3394355 RepID=UPI0039B3FF03